MIHIQQLVKSFKLDGHLLPILDVPYWSINKGEQIALLGPSGSGKSTLLHMIGGVLSPDEGTIEIAGTTINLLKESQRDMFRAANIGYIFQDFHLIPSLTAKQNVELVLPRAMSKDARKIELQKWFDRVGLIERMNHMPAQLSRGQQQRVAIIRALINNPTLILADEPTGSLDWETANLVMRLLLDLCREEQLTLLTVTHDIHLAKLFPTTVQMSSLNRLLEKNGARGGTH